MKKLLTILLISGLTLTIFAQTPLKLSYQAVIRNTSGALVTNHSVGMRISILQGSATGTAVYVETHTTTTNANGLATIVIGGGSVVTGTFAGINWESGTYYIKTETDPAGGSSYSITGTSQILSVPYALYSKSAANGFTLPYSGSGTTSGGLDLFYLKNLGTGRAMQVEAATNTAIWGKSAGGYAGIDGRNTTGYGVYGESAKYGVYGKSTDNQGRSVTGEASGTASIGVFGKGVAESSTGVWGEGANQGVYGLSELETGKGVYGRATSATGINYGIHGQTSSSSGFSGYFTGGKFYISGNTGIGTGTTTPVALLHVQGTGVSGGNVVFIGQEKETSPGDPPVSGTGTRMMWYPDKAAFRAGYASGLVWDKSYIGRYSIAMGIGTIASGYATTALGYFSKASGRLSTAMGCGTTAYAFSSTAIGRFNVGGGNAEDWVAADPLFEIGNGSSAEARSNAMTVLKNGNVGIGPSNPAYKLQVGVAGDGSQARANAWNLLSDARLKKDFSGIANPLNMVELINGYYFNWNTGTDRSRQVGFSAQEVLEIFPEVVSQGADGYLSIEYGKMAPLLLEAIKAQQKEIESLRAQLEKIQKFINLDSE